MIRSFSKCVSTELWHRLYGLSLSVCPLNSYSGINYTSFSKCVLFLHGHAKGPRFTVSSEGLLQSLHRVRFRRNPDETAHVRASVRVVTTLGLVVESECSCAAAPLTRVCACVRACVRACVYTET